MQLISLGRERHWRQFFFGISIVVLLSTGLIFLGIFSNSRNLLDQELLERARAHFQSIVLTREWNARHGGVFVEKRPGIESNRYLANPDIQTREGAVYTKKNPALMTREISELAAGKGLFQYHITSLKPINPNNAADPFERKALLSFKQGEREATEKIKENGQTIFRYMAPLMVEDSCLQCHAAQGYNVGDIRGGISVKFGVGKIAGGIVRNAVEMGGVFLLALTLILAAGYRLVSRLQDRLRASAERWQFALEGAGDAVWDWNVRTGRVFFSPRWKSMLGFDDDEIDDRFEEWEKRVHPDDIKRCHADLERHFNRETPVYINEHRMRCKDGGFLWTLGRGKVIEWTEDEKPLRVIGTQADISSRKATEEALRESERRLTTLVGNLPGMVYRCRNVPSWPMEFVGGNVEEITGYGPEEIGPNGKIVYADLIHPDDRKRVWEETQKALQEHRSFDYVFRMRTADGKERTVWEQGVGIYSTEREILALEGLILDVSERTRVENALHEGEARLRAIFENTPVCLNLKDVEGRYLLLNKPYEDWLGYTAAEIVGKTATEFMPPSEEVENLTKAEMQVIETGEPVVREVHVPRNGEFFDRILIKFPVKTETGAVSEVGTVAVDITERKRAEEALRQSEERFAKAFQASPAPMSISSIVEGENFDVNDEWLAMMGFERDEVIGKTSTELGAWTGATRRSDFINRLKKDGSLRNMEATVVTKSGNKRTVLLSGETIDEQRMLLVFHDITERLEMEQRLAHAQKMEAVGQLTGGLAHDLNNTLGIILGNVELLKIVGSNSPDLSNFAEAAKSGVLRASDLTRKLLDFSRTRAGDTKRVSLNGFVAGMENLIAKCLTPAITLEMSISEDTWTVDINPGDLEAALLNLALNARDAMPNGGTLIIETANTAIDEDYVGRNPTSSTGEFVMISVSDTGTGMTPEVAEKVFEPFFTTKEVGQGTGLGLSMVYAFVQRSGGHVKIYSEPGEGTTVRLYLPRVRGATEEDNLEIVDETSLPRGGERILVVDDEEELAEAAARILGSLGYRTVTAANGSEALEILRRNPSIDLLFTDVIMPGAMNGYRLAIEALKDRPDLKILLTSGFTRKREEFVNGERRIAAELAKTLLDKPYNIAKLARAIRRALDQGTVGTG